MQSSLQCHYVGSHQFSHDYAGPTPFAMEILLQHVVLMATARQRCPSRIVCHPLPGVITAMYEYKMVYQRWARVCTDPNSRLAPLIWATPLPHVSRGPAPC